MFTLRKEGARGRDRVEARKSLLRGRCFAIRYSRGEIKMGFIMEFAENLILRMMEDPKERDRRFREHLYTLQDKCKKTKEMWSLPLRPYGFWTFDRHNTQLARDAQISNVTGRRDPYDEVLDPIYKKY
ncbi:hypothetical protein Dimus_034560 [Dionaea muscipula]